MGEGLLSMDTIQTDMDGMDGWNGTKQDKTKGKTERPTTGWEGRETDHQH